MVEAGLKRRLVDAAWEGGPSSAELEGRLRDVEGRRIRSAGHTSLLDEAGKPHRVVEADRGVVKAGDSILAADAIELAGAASEIGWHAGGGRLTRAQGGELESASAQATGPEFISAQAGGMPVKVKRAAEETVDEGLARLGYSAGSRDAQGVEVEAEGVARTVDASADLVSKAKAELGRMGVPEHEQDRVLSMLAAADATRLGGAEIPATEMLEAAAKAGAKVRRASGWRGAVKALEDTVSRASGGAATEFSDTMLRELMSHRKVRGERELLRWIEGLLTDSGEVG